MDFKRYNSIENHTNAKFMRMVAERGLFEPSIVWTAREKVHGANFGFWFDGSNFKFSRRSDFVDFDTEQFFGFQNIAVKYTKQFEEMYNDMVAQRHISFGETMVIYGELAGTMPSGKSVQCEVEYGPLDFYAFDMILGSRTVNDTELENLSETYDFKVAPLLKIGTFEELTQSIPVDLQSVVNEDGVNIRVGTTNIAEGYVLKPNVPHWIGAGHRVIFKCKNEKFAEGKGKTKVKSVFVPLSEKDQDILSTVESLITENRLKNVLSKYGVPQLKDFGIIVKLLLQDVNEQIVTDELIGTSGGDDIPALNKEVGALLSKLIRPHWVNICNNEF
ncbi:MAG: RNA ligase family protein [Culicoidibacterales bacterium]